MRSMADPIFTNEPAPAFPPRRRLSSGMKIAIGCGVLLLLAGGACGGALLWCGSSLSGLGEREWKELVAVANDLGTDAGAQAAYAAHPGLAEAYPTAEDFVGAARLWRRDLEPLPAARPPITSGRLTAHQSYDNGASRMVLGYRLASGKTLVGTWSNQRLVDLQLQ